MNTESISKNFSLYIGALYVMGFVILNLHLVNYGIFIKDFFTLDYLKCSILFVVLFGTPSIVLYKQLTSDTHWFKRISIQIMVGFTWLFVITNYFFFEYTIKSNNFPWEVIFVSAIFISFISDFAIKIRDKEQNLHFFTSNGAFIIASLFYFATQVYPKVKFEYGGGNSYSKSIIIKIGDRINELKEVNVVYESEKAIYIKKDSMIETIPRDQILKEFFIIK